MGFKKNTGRVEVVKLHISNRTLQELLRMALIRPVAFVVIEILCNLNSMQNFLTAVVSKISKTFQRKLTFIFDVLPEPCFGFVSYLVF